MEKLLREFYEANRRPIWFSEASQIRKFSEWADEHGHDAELTFVDGKRNRLINFIGISLGLSVIIAMALGWHRYVLNFSPIGILIIIFLPLFAKRTPILTRAQQAGDRKPDHVPS